MNCFKPFSPASKPGKSGSTFYKLFPHFFKTILQFENIIYTVLIDLVGI
jgi:hypothetical protein